MANVGSFVIYMGLGDRIGTLLPVLGFFSMLSTALARLLLNTLAILAPCSSLQAKCLCNRSFINELTCLSRSPEGLCGIVSTMGPLRNMFSYGINVIK